MRIIETITRNIEKEPCRTAAQMEQICCKETDALLCCEEDNGTWNGYSDEEILDSLGVKLDKYGRNKDGQYVTIERVQRKNPCGQKLTEYNTAGHSCCEEVADIKWDSLHSASVIADMSSGVIVVTGGRLPFKISVRGDGFYLERSRRWKDGTVDGRAIEIFTSTACGACQITITDGCSTLTHSIRSVNGEWVRRPDDTIVHDHLELQFTNPQFQYLYLGTCHPRDSGYWCHTLADQYNVGVGTSARWQVTEWILYMYWASFGDGYAKCDECPSSGIKWINQVPGWDMGHGWYPPAGGGCSCIFTKYRLVMEWIC